MAAEDHSDLRGGKPRLLPVFMKRIFILPSTNIQKEKGRGHGDNL